MLLLLLIPAIVMLVVSAFLQIFSLWQLDLIVCNPVWDTPDFLEDLKRKGITEYQTEYFQCFIWKTTIGQAYDTLFLINHLAYWVAFASTIVVFVGWFI